MPLSCQARWCKRWTIVPWSPAENGVDETEQGLRQWFVWRRPWKAIDQLSPTPRSTSCRASSTSAISISQEIGWRSTMADLFELWRSMWSTAISRGLDSSSTRSWSRSGQATASATAIDLSAFPTLGRVQIELATMLLLEQRSDTAACSGGIDRRALRGSRRLNRRFCSQTQRSAISV